MHPNADEVHKIYGDGYEIVLKNKKVLVYGSCTVVVQGNAALEVKGDAVSKIDGNSVSYVKGQTKISSEKDITLSTESKLVINSTDTIKINSPKLKINADVYVKGELNATRSISSDKNILAGHNVICLWNAPAWPTELVLVPSPPIWPVGLAYHFHFDFLTGVTGVPVPWVSAFT